MVNIKILLKEHNQITFQEIKLLKLQVIQNLMDIKEDWLQWFLSFLIKSQKSKGSGVTTVANKSAIKSLSNQQLANEKVYSSFEDNIWGADLADVQSTQELGMGCSNMHGFVI